jgi:DNA-binding TFAR19-related protein (PDSD5 family)
VTLRQEMEYQARAKESVAANKDDMTTKVLTKANKDNVTNIKLQRSKTNVQVCTKFILMFSLALT